MQCQLKSGPDASPDYALSEEAARIRQRAFDCVSNGILISDANLPDFPVVDCNPAFERITGYTRDEVIGRNCRFLQGVDNEQPGLDILRTAIRELRECTVLLRNYRKDGSLFWNELTVTPVLGNQGSVTHFVAILDDVSGRIKGESDFKRHQDELESIFQALPDLYFRLFADGTVLEYHANRLAGLDVEPNEFLNRRVQEMVPPAVGQRFVECLQRTLIHGTTESTEYSLDSPDGEEFYEARFVRLRFDQAVVIVRNMTQRKRAGRHTQQLISQLAHFNRLGSMGEMATGLAHEINQPLGAIANYAGTSVELARKNQISTPDLVGAMEDINRQALRAGSIVNRLKRFVSSVKPERDLVHINTLVQEVEALLHPDAKQSGATLKLELSQELPTVLADTVQVQQVLVNLVKNAFEAMDHHSSEMRVVRLCTALADGHVEVSVSDTGPGIGDQEVGQLFAPFFTTKNHGMGLGLSIARTIIEAHKGKLLAQPNEDRGMTFRFTLPVAQPNHSQDDGNGRSGANATFLQP